MIDFDRLVLGPAMDVFAVPVTIQPQAIGQGPYTARGVYSEQPVDVQMEDGSILSSASKTLGIRYSDFAIAPKVKDRVVINGTTFMVEDLDDDGQGGSVLTLKQISR